MTEDEFHEYTMFVIKACFNIPVGLKQWERAQELEKKHDAFMKTIKFPCSYEDIIKQLKTNPNANL